MNRNTKIALWGCGGILGACVLILLVVGPVALALRMLGFRSLGTTDQYLATAEATQPTPDWTTLLGNGPLETNGNLPLPLVSVQSVQVNVQGQTAVIDTTAVHAEQVSQGETATGQPIFYAEYNETGANALADDLLTQYAPPDLRQQLRNPSLDFRPSVVVMHAEANLPPLGWQPAAVILLFNEAGTQFTVTGVEVAGQLFSTPPSGPLADWVNLLQTEGNRALLETQLVSNGQPVNIHQIFIDHNILQVIAR
ncbi:MAG: hypothetical protein IPL28_18605 [Chloroflexi bacterium]|nr:hypothetical protein [Chloroflexota bacterium]MDA0245524.1 hypothetical protein [Chloroflexota bacterium]